MKLKAKIKKEYLDAILSGEKGWEYRQFESIIFVDEKGREIEFEIRHIRMVDSTDETLIRRVYSDIPFLPDKPIFQIFLGRMVS